VDYNGSAFKSVDYGAITTPSGMPFEQRLGIIFDEVDLLVERYKPQGMGLEKLYFTKNVTTGIDVAQARGIILLCGYRHGMSIGQYTPLQVKQSVAGYGKAEKEQVMQMTKTLLGLSEIPRPDDTADALAVAICHAHSSSSRRGANVVLA